MRFAHKYRLCLLFMAIVFTAPGKPAGAVEAESDTDGDVSGTWFVEGRTRHTPSGISLEIKVESDELRSGTLLFHGRNIGGTFARSTLVGRDFNIECPFVQNGENRTIALQGTITDDMWVGRYRVTDSSGARVMGGRFTGRRLEGSVEYAGRSNVEFPGIWIGHYEVFGERFPIRFQIADGRGAVFMPDEIIRASIIEYVVAGDKAALTATWEIPEQGLTAKAHFSGKIDASHWSGDYIVSTPGKTQPVAKGSFFAHRIPENGKERWNRVGITSMLAQPPLPNGFLQGTWQGYYQCAGSAFGLSVELRIADNKYIGTIFLPDDRLEAVVSYASDAGHKMQVIGLGEPLDDEGNSDSLTINLIGGLHGDVWRGTCNMDSGSVSLDGIFYLTRQ